MGKFITTTELAGIVGSSRTTLAKAIDAGRLTVAKRDGRGRPLFDSKVAVKEWAEWEGTSARKSRHKDGKATGGRPTTVDTAEIEAVLAKDGVDVAALFGDAEGLTPGQKQQRADLLNSILSAKQKDLKIRREEGILCVEAEVGERQAELGAMIVNALLGMIPRLSGLLSAESDPHVIDGLLLAEINHVIALITNAWNVRVEQLKAEQE